MEVLATYVLLLAGLHVTAQVEGVTVNVDSHLTHLNTHRYPNSKHEAARKRAQDYITERFEEYGLRVDYQLIKAFASPDPTDPSTCPTEDEREECYVNGVNVIGVSGPEKEEKGAVLVVGAAYDTTGVGSPLYDNGVGVAVLLEVARVYQRIKPHPRLSTLFVAFDLSVESYYRTQEEVAKEDEGEQNGKEEGGKGGGKDDGSTDGELKEGRRDEEIGGVRTGTGGKGASIGGLPGGWSLVQDYLWSFLGCNASRFGGGIMLGTLLNVNHRNNSQGLDDRMQELFPDAYEHIASEGFKGNFVAMVTREEEGDEAALTLRHQVMESYEQVGGRLVVFSLGNRSHTLLPPALPPRQAAHFWGATQGGRAAPLPAVLLTDTEVYRRWSPNAPAPYTQLTEEQRAFLDTTVTSLAHLLARRDTQAEPTNWLGVGLGVTLVVTWVVNILLLSSSSSIASIRRGARFVTHPTPPATAVVQPGKPPCSHPFHPEKISA